MGLPLLCILRAIVLNGAGWSFSIDVVLLFLIVAIDVFAFGVGCWEVVASEEGHGIADIGGKAEWSGVY
jgi:hypothetical protein